MAEPTDERIQQFIDYTCFGSIDQDRKIVVNALKANGNDPTKPINDYFVEGQDAFIKTYSQVPQAWDESAFTGDRDGAQHTPQSFHVETPYQGSEVIHGVDPSRSAAPSRPPSRTNGQAFDRVADWATETAGVPDTWDQDMEINQGDQEDDMAKALRISREEAEAQGIEVPQQETGVTSMAPLPAPQFGPATQEHYDENQWGMVPASTARLPEVAPSKRERQEGVPAFLVDSPDRLPDSRLGAYLTILHEIPRARNVYLKDRFGRSSCGYDPQWWKGEVISHPDDDGNEEELEHDIKIKICDELSRLMAFLDGTTRSYATIDALVSLWPHLPDERAYHNEFTALFDEESIKDTLLTTVDGHNVVIGNDGSIDDAPDDEEGETQNVHSFQIDFRRAEYQGLTNLYSVLDALSWGDVIEEAGKPGATIMMGVLEHEAHVFAVNMTGDGPAVPIDVPEVLYRERWLSSRTEEAKKIIKELCKLKREESDANKAKLEVWRTPGLGDPRKFFNAAKTRFENHREYLTGRARFRVLEESGFDLDKYPDYHMAPCDMIDEERALDTKLEEAAAAAQSRLEDGKRRSEALNEELDRIHKKRQALSHLLTNPDKKGRPDPMSCKKYLLRGVATRNNTLYVCKRAQEDLIDLAEAETQEKDQWWRLELKPQDDADPVKAETLDFEAVHARMWEETKTPLLVYATEDALRDAPTALPATLQQFVKADNKTFQQELSQEVPDTVWEGDMQAQGNGVPFSPSKRKHRDSNDSMDSNRPAIGSDDGNADDPFRDGSGGSSPHHAQKRMSPGSSTEEQKPPLPRRPGSTSTPGAQSTILVPSIEVTDTKGPEMQQRPQPSIFAGRDNKESSADQDIDMVFGE